MNAVSSLSSKAKSLGKGLENWTKPAIKNKNPTLLDFINWSQDVLWRIVDKTQTERNFFMLEIIKKFIS